MTCAVDEFESECREPTPFARIGAVVKELGVAAHVIRYWESEFGLRPERSQRGQRVYTRKQIEKLIEIKRLLRDEKYTIAGARQKLGR